MLPRKSIGLIVGATLVVALLKSMGWRRNDTITEIATRRKKIVNEVGALYSCLFSLPFLSLSE